MRIASIFQFFVPKETRFFPIFTEAAENIIDASEALTQLVSEYPGRKDEIIKKVKEFEHKGDGITHKILDELNNTFVTPFDREDIQRLALDMDDILDFINSAAQKILLYNPAESLKDYAPFTDLIRQCALEVKNAIIELPNLNHPEKIESACIKINELENKTDFLFDVTISKLFQEEKNAIELIKFKEIIQTLEKVTDSAERVADALKRIIVKLA